MKVIILMTLLCFSFSTCVFAYDFEDSEKSNTIVNNMEKQRIINRKRRASINKRSRAIINKKRDKRSSQREWERQRLLRHNARMTVEYNKYLRDKRRLGQNACLYNPKLNKTDCS
jgi:uncharacterized membrane protein